MGLVELTCTQSTAALHVHRDAVCIYASSFQVNEMRPKT